MAKIVFSRFRGNDQQRAEITDVLGNQDDGVFYVVSGDADADALDIDRGNIDAYNASRGDYGAEYYASVIRDADKYELSENHTPTNPTQIKIFGYFPTVGDALRDLMEKGNTTNDGRKPALVYI